MQTMSANKKLNGFTLIEMAIVLLILGILLGSVLVPLSVQMLNQKIKETRATLSHVRDAIIGFAVINKRLPCPDTSGNGEENGPNCNDVEGAVPWSTLGVGRYDAWSKPLRYRIDNNYSSSIANPPNTTSGISIQDLKNTALSIANPNAPIVIIFSCGADGRPNKENDADGMTNSDANCSNPGTANETYTQDNYIENQFDDILIWVSKNTLLNHLVSAGAWP